MRRTSAEPRRGAPLTPRASTHLDDAEDHVLSIEEGGRLEGDEELTFVAVRPRIGHTENSFANMSKTLVEFVRKRRPENTCEEKKHQKIEREGRKMRFEVANQNKQERLGRGTIRFFE